MRNGIRDSRLDIPYIHIGNKEAKQMSYVSEEDIQKAEHELQVARQNLVQIEENAPTAASVEWERQHAAARGKVAQAESNLATRKVQRAQVERAVAKRQQTVT